MQAEQWCLIEDDAEYAAVWEAFMDLLSFNPSKNRAKGTFDFTKITDPVIAYDISGISTSDFEAHDKNGNYRATECISILKFVFIACMGEDEFMYALDWQHSAFKYNPRIDTAYGYYTMYSALPNTRAYYPDFHPNSDYFFFIAKDLSWGYLTHPWLRTVWFYGSKLVASVEKQAERLGFCILI